MKTDIWTNALREFKDGERPETVLMVSGNPELLRIVVAWQATVSTRAQRLTKCACTTEYQRWYWLWVNAVYMKADLLNQIPGPRENAEQRFNALIASRVLYPDGTINSFVEKYLRKRVLALLGIHRRREATPGAKVQ